MGGCGEVTLKIVHLTPPLEHLGNGVMTAAMDLAVEQVAQGDAVVVCASAGNLSAALRDAGVQAVDLDVEFSVRSAVRTVRKLRKVLLDAKPDVIHAHTLRGLMIAFAASRFLKASPPVVFSAHNGPSYRAFLLAAADVVVAVSSADAEALRKWPLFRVETVLNGPLGGVRSRPPENVGLENPAIVFVGGLYYRKGVDVLIDAFELIPRDRHASLYLVGDGPDRSAFERKALGSGVNEHIHFVGFAPNAKDYMVASDIFVLPSRHEPFGLVLAEAREAGAAIVATAIGGIPEVLEDGRAGVLVPSEDSQALATAILSLLDDENARSLLRAAAQTNITWLSVTRVAQEMRNAYQRTLDLSKRSQRPIAKNS